LQRGIEAGIARAQCFAGRGITGREVVQDHDVGGIIDIGDAEVALNLCLDQTSAADLKFLTQPRQNQFRNFRSKAALESWIC
jgi:hypothetical protein